jgi:hypothetical protein
LVRKPKDKGGLGVINLSVQKWCFTAKTTW